MQATPHRVTVSWAPPQKTLEGGDDSVERWTRIAERSEGSSWYWPDARREPRLVPGRCEVSQGRNPKTIAPPEGWNPDDLHTALAHDGGRLWLSRAIVGDSLLVALQLRGKANIVLERMAGGDVTWSGSSDETSRFTRALAGALVGGIFRLIDNRGGRVDGRVLQIVPTLNSQRGAPVNAWLNPVVTRFDWCAERAREDDGDTALDAAGIPGEARVLGIEPDLLGVEDAGVAARLWIHHRACTSAKEENGAIGALAERDPVAFVLLDLLGGTFTIDPGDGSAEAKASWSDARATRSRQQRRLVNWCLERAGIAHGEERGEMKAVEANPIPTATRGLPKLALTLGETIRAKGDESPAQRELLKMFDGAESRGVATAAEGLCGTLAPQSAIHVRWPVPPCELGEHDRQRWARERETSVIDAVRSVPGGAWEWVTRIEEKARRQRKESWSVQEVYWPSAYYAQMFARRTSGPTKGWRMDYAGGFGDAPLGTLKLGRRRVGRIETALSTMSIDPQGR